MDSLPKMYREISKVGASTAGAYLTNCRRNYSWTDISWFQSIGDIYGLREQHWADSPREEKYVAGPPVSIGCAVVVAPGIAGAPDSGSITFIPPGGPMIGGLPLAIAGSICTMINSLSGVPYTLPIGSLSPSQVRINGQPLVRVGDAIPSGPGVMTILGPPAASFITDGTG